MVQQQPHVEVKSLPLTVQTILIDGKRMSSSFFKQLVEESLIDEETGELRGTPLGWINVHPKEGCPEYAHLHVLWTRGTSLRLATVLRPEANKRYQEKRQVSITQRQQLIDLLACVLAPSHRYQASSYRNDEQQTLKIENYTLPVTTSIGHLLNALEEARTCVDEDIKDWRRQSQDQTDLDKALLCAQDIEQLLKKQRISLAHPKLYNHDENHSLTYDFEDEDLWGEVDGLQIYKDYDTTTDRLIRFSRLGKQERPQATRPKRGKWFIYAAINQPSSDEDQLLWYTEPSINEEEAQKIESLLAPQMQLLRISLAKQTEQDDLQILRKKTKQLTTALQAVLTPTEPAKGNKKKREQSHTQIHQKSIPTPTDIFDLYQQEIKCFDDYTQHWLQEVATLHELDQLFIVS